MAYGSYSLATCSEGIDVMDVDDMLEGIAGVVWWAVRCNRGLDNQSTNL